MKTKAEYLKIHPGGRYKGYIRGFHIPDKDYGEWNERSKSRHAKNSSKK